MNDTLTEILEELDIFEGEEVELSQTNTTNNKLLYWGFRWQKHNKLKEVSKMSTEIKTKAKAVKLTQFFGGVATILN